MPPSGTIDTKAVKHIYGKPLVVLGNLISNLSPRSEHTTMLELMKLTSRKYVFTCKSNQVNFLLKCVKQVKVTCRISDISEFDLKSDLVQFLRLVSAQISEIRDSIAAF